MATRIVLTVMALTLLFMALTAPAHAAPGFDAPVTAVTGWAYANSQGAGAGTYVVRAPVLRVEYGKYYTTYGWVLHLAVVYRANSRQVTWQPTSNSWTNTVNSFGYHALGLDTPLVW